MPQAPLQETAPPLPTPPNSLCRPHPQDLRKEKHRGNEVGSGEQSLGSRTCSACQDPNVTDLGSARTGWARRTQLDAQEGLSTKVDVQPLSEVCVDSEKRLLEG